MQDHHPTINKSYKEVSTDNVGFDDDLFSNNNLGSGEDEGDEEERESVEGDKEESNTKGDETISDDNSMDNVLYLTCNNCKREQSKHLIQKYGRNSSYHIEFVTHYH